MYGLTNNYGLNPSLVNGATPGITANQFGQALSAYNTGPATQQTAQQADQNLWANLPGPSDSMHRSQAILADPSVYQQHETNLVTAGGKHGLTYNNGTPLESLAQLAAVATAFASPFVAAGLGAEATPATIGSKLGSTFASDLATGEGAGGVISGGSGVATLGGGGAGAAEAAPDLLTTDLSMAGGASGTGAAGTAASLAGKLASGLSSFGGSGSSSSPNVSQDYNSQSALTHASPYPQSQVAQTAGGQIAPSSSSPSALINASLPVYSAYNPPTQQQLLAQALVSHEIQNKALNNGGPVDPNAGLNQLLKSGYMK